MKFINLVFFAFLLSFSSLWAGFKLPSGIYKHNQVKEAAKAAEKNGKALMFILSNTGTT